MLTNLCLAGVLLQRYHQQTLAQERATAELLTLFDNQGVALDGEYVLWDEPLKTLELAQDANLCQAIAQSLLNENITTYTTQVDDSILYENENGSVSFAIDGTIDASGVLGDGTMLTYIQSFCQTYGYDSVTVISDGDAGTVTASVTYRGTLVSGISLQFTLDAGCLVSVTGTVLPQTHSATGESAPVTCLTALSRFLATRRTTGAVVSTVNQVSACYSFSSSSNIPMALLPQWKIDTDNGTYYVDGNTGQVSYG